VSEQTSAETAAIDSMDANPSLFAGEDLAVLIRYMADSGDYAVDDIAYAVEKPWKYTSVLAEALTALAGKS